MPIVTRAPSDFEQLMLEYINRARADPEGEFDVFMQAQERLAEIMLPRSIMTVVANNAIVGFIVGSLATEPRTNKHGPVPGTEHDEFS